MKDADATITPQDLLVEMEGPSPPVLLDLLPPEAYEGEHLAGAASACVYEVGFPGHVKNALGDRPADTPIVVYGLSDDFLAARRGVERLAGIGHRNVRRLLGGLEAWRAAGFPIEGAGIAPAPPLLADGTHAVDAEASSIGWTGRNAGNLHFGSLRFATGHATVIDGLVADARFVVDMNSITCADIEDPKLNALLVAHLESDDFFDVAHHPTAVFTSRSVTPIDDAPPGLPNCRVEGTLAMRGVEGPLAFNALVGRSFDGRPVAQAHFDIDRTVWGIAYGSGRLFERLGSHLVNDHVSLQLKLVFASG